MITVGIFDKLKWFCFCFIFHRLCLYHRMKAVLWTKEEHYKKLRIKEMQCPLDK